MAKLFSTLTVAFTALAVILRWAFPGTGLRVPGGWPLGSHWYRIDAAAFWLCASAAMLFALLWLINFALRRRTDH